jgi:hypothetical protein
MNVVTVVTQEDGSFMLNNKYGVPNDSDNPEMQYIQKWIDAGNTPDPYVGLTALENWVEDMARSDTALLPRYAEDILDGMANKLSVPQITLDRLQAKKDLRATKP